MTSKKLHVLNALGNLMFDEAELSRRLPDLAITISKEAEMLEQEIGEAEILLTNKKIDIGALRPHAPMLKWVQVTSAGVENLLTSLPKDVLLTNASGVHSEKGAEFILTSVLLLNYRIPEFMEQQRCKIWEQDFVRTLRGKSVVVLGSGAIGSVAIRLLAERGMRVIAVNRSGKAAMGAEQTVTLAGLDTVLSKAQFLVSTLPATAQTCGIIGAPQLKALPSGAGIVSVGRAAVFDHSALCEALRRGDLGGAVLDVFPTEPLASEDPTWEVPGLVVTPHCSVDDLEGYMDRCLDIFARNLKQYRAGQRMETQVDPAQGY